MTKRVALVLAVLLATCSSIAVATMGDPPTSLELLEKIQALEERVAVLEKLLDQSNNGDTPDTRKETGGTDEPGPEEWRELARGWEYRNPTIRPGSFGYYTFLVEIRRTGSSVRMANFTVTIFDAVRKIAGTGSAFLMDLETGQFKTTEFMLQGDPAKAETFRLQVDSSL